MSCAAGSGGFDARTHTHIVSSSLFLSLSHNVILCLGLQRGTPGETTPPSLPPALPPNKNLLAVYVSYWLLKRQHTPPFWHWMNSMSSWTNETANFHSRPSLRCVSAALPVRGVLMNAHACIGGDEHACICACTHAREGECYA